MSKLPEEINVFVYRDAIPFMADKGKVLRVTDHTPPDDIECELSTWAQKDLTYPRKSVDALIGKANDLLERLILVAEASHHIFAHAANHHLPYTGPNYGHERSELVEAIAALQQEANK